MPPSLFLPSLFELNPYHLSILSKAPIFGREDEQIFTPPLAQIRRLLILVKLIVLMQFLYHFVGEKFILLMSVNLNKSLGIQLYFISNSL